MILNRKGKFGAGEHSPKAIVAIIAIVLLAYGYYGYFYVPQNSGMGYGTQQFCPFGRESAGYAGVAGTGACAGAKTALMFGALALLGLIVWHYVTKGN